MFDVPVLLALIVLVALLFDFTNGAHDCANAIATVVSTKVVTPRFAVGAAALLNLGGALLGVLSLHFIPQLALEGDFCRISYFCVSSNARSKGIGRLLESEGEALARARGCDRIEVHCHSRRSDAHRFYYRQGYTESPKYLCKSLANAEEQG